MLQMLQNATRSQACRRSSHASSAISVRRKVLHLLHVGREQIGTQLVINTIDTLFVCIADRCNIDVSARSNVASLDSAAQAATRLAATHQ